MPTVTPDLWAEHYQDLRPYVVERWPDIDEGKLGAIVGDFEALVGVVASTTGMDERVARMELLAIDVDEADVQGPGGRQPSASLAQLRLGPGFPERDRDMVVANLEKLDRRLERFPADAVDMEVSVQERDTTAQVVVLEAWLPKYPHLVAKSGEEDLGMALREVRDNMWRQIDDAVNRRIDRR